MKATMIPDVGWNMNHISFAECDDGSEQFILSIHNEDDPSKEATVRMTHDQFERFARFVNLARITKI